MRAAAFVASLLLAAACGSGGDSDSDDRPDDKPNETSDTFAAFVIDLVQNHTVDDAEPVAFDVFSTLPDPEGDNNEADAFSVLF